MAVLIHFSNRSKTLLLLLVVCVASIYFLASKGCGETKLEPKQPATWKKVPFPNTRN